VRRGVKFINRKYQAVIFDLYGTLINKLSLREYKEDLRRMASELSVPPDDLIRLWFDTQNERGLGIFQSHEDNIKYICDKLEWQAGDAQIEHAVQTYLKYTADSAKLRPHAIEVLTHLKADGYKTGLITDCSASIPRIFKDIALAPLIDTAIFSCSVGMLKPDPRIYRLAVEQLAVEPEACLYIGDGDDNELTGALQVGMHPVLIRNPDEDSHDVDHTDWEAEAWPGPVITSLQEVMNLVK
jgi:putative hydrolase of the HAD superfamily